MTFWRRKGVQSTVLLLSYLIVFIMFVAGPLLQTVISSFSGDAGLFEYYRTAFAMPEFRRALSHTVGYTFLAALLVMLLAFPTAFMIHRVVNRYRRLRYIVAMPYASGMMSLAMIWLMFFNGSTGLVNKLLPLFGLSPQNWLETPVLAFLCVSARRTEVEA